MCRYKMESGARNDVCGVSDKVRPKSAFSATETSYNNEMLYEASLDGILCRWRKTKALIRLCRFICTFVVRVQQASRPKCSRKAAHARTTLFLSSRKIFAAGDKPIRNIAFNFNNS